MTLSLPNFSPVEVNAERVRAGVCLCCGASSVVPRRLLPPSQQGRTWCGGATHTSRCANHLLFGFESQLSLHVQIQALSSFYPSGAAPSLAGHSHSEVLHNAPFHSVCTCFEMKIKRQMERSEPRPHGARSCVWNQGAALQQCGSCCCWSGVLASNG